MALTPKTPPRNWQLEAFSAWKAAKERGVVEVVTGAGKTLLALMCMGDFLGRGDGRRVVVLVPTLALLDQWVVSVSEELGIAESDIGVYSGKSRPSKPALVNIMTLNTGRSEAPPLTRTADTLLVLDECHRAASPANALGLDAPYAAVLGMSATPEREFDTAFDDRILPIAGAIIYTYDYARARREGVIAPFHLINVSIALTAQEQEQYDLLTRRIARLAKDKDDSRLEILLRARAAVSKGATHRVPTSVRIVENHRSERLLVFHEQIASADAIARELMRRGMRSASYHSQVGAALRVDNLRLYRRGVFNVLVTCRALDEGINVPETSVAVVASSTSSTRQRIQRLGRVLRPSPGKTAATVYTLYATGPEEERLRREAGDVGADDVVWMRSRMRNG